MYPAAIAAIAQAVAKYVAENYADQKLNRKFQKLERAILAAIERAKDEIIAALHAIEMRDIRAGVENTIRDFGDYDRDKEEIPRLWSIVDQGGDRLDRIKELLKTLPPNLIEYHILFSLWTQVALIRAFGMTELGYFGAKEKDDVVRAFCEILRECDAAWTGIETLNRARFGGPIIRGEGPGEGFSLGYYKDGDFRSVDFDLIPGRLKKRSAARDEMDKDMVQSLQDLPAAQTIINVREALSTQMSPDELAGCDDGSAAFDLRN